MAIKVGITIPNEGHTLPEAYDNRLQFAFHLGKYEDKSRDAATGIPKFEFYWGTVGRVLTPLARERLTEWGIEMGLDLILMIDDDMIIPLDMFERLYDTMVKHNADVVAPLAFMRNAPHYPVIYRAKEGYDAIAKKPYFIRDFVKTYPKDSVVECDAVGFGSALINLSMVKRMKKPYFMSTTGAGEDIWFCYCAKKEAGAKIVMDTSVKLGHMGTPALITEETYEQVNDVKRLREVFGDAPREKANA